MYTFLLQLCLFGLAMAEETVSAAGHGDAWKFGTGGGIIGFIVLILDVIVWSTCAPSLSPPDLVCMRIEG